MKTAKRLTPRDVRAALDKQYGRGVIAFYRAREGYYYFTASAAAPSRANRIPSLYWYDLIGVKLDEIMKHVADTLADPLA